MFFDLFFFVLSLLYCCFIIYVIAFLWFSNAHSRYLVSFAGMGVNVCLWTLFSSMALVAGEDRFVFVFTIHSMIACTFPYIFLWYSLHFTKSKLVKSPVAAIILIIIPVAEMILCATNPWHKLLFISYDNYPNLQVGPIFPLHAVVAYAAILIALTKLFTYVFKMKRKTPIMIAAVFSTLIPYILNIMFSLNIVRSKLDLTAFTFSLAFTLFFLASHHSGMFSFKSIAISSIFTSLTDMLIIIDKRGNIIDVNTSFKRSFPDFPIVEGITSTSDFSDWLSERVTARTPDNLLAAFSDISVPTEGGEFSILDMNNDMRTYTLRRESTQKGKKTTGHIITMSDFTAYRGMISEINSQNEDLLELKELAEEASRTKSTFLANMSHELRTPINAITGMAAIAKGTDNLDKIHNCLGKVDVASRQLLGIINDILDMSKIEANKMELSPEPFDLHALLENIKHIIDVRVAEKNQNFTVTIADNVPRAVMGDDLRVSQILLNLLSNSVKFTPVEGNISLDLKLLSARDGVYHIEASVTDDGIGITAEQQSRLFSSFEQADKGTAKQYGGTGLGLAITKNLTELMGGGILLESEPGRGSKFTVNFRLQAGCGNDLKKPANNQSYDFTGRTALLAEDVEINCEILIALLEDCNIKIDCAKNGKESVDLFTSNPGKYDIIFMDIQMPVMDGYTATELIRASSSPAAQTVPILAMTANAFSEDIAKCRAVGMNDHISKPIDMNLLLQKMNTLMKNYR